MNGINLSVHEPIWPQQCVCCNAPSDTSIPLEYVDEVKHGQVLYRNGWQIPHCSHCAEHVQSALSLTKKTFLKPIPSLGSLFVVVLSLIGCVAWESLWPLIGTLLLLQAILAYYQWKTIKKAQTMMKPDCCYHGLAVECVSHHEFQGDMVTFNFKNKEYARLFKSLNQAKANSSAAAPQKTLVA